MEKEKREKKELSEKIGQNLAAARIKVGLTQEKLAEMVGVESNSIHRYEKGQRDMRFTTAIQITKALNISMYELIPEEYTEHNVSKESEDQLVSLFSRLDEQDQIALMKQMTGLQLLKRQSA